MRAEHQSRMEEWSGTTPRERSTKFGWRTCSGARPWGRSAKVGRWSLRLGWWRVGLRAWSVWSGRWSLHTGRWKVWLGARSVWWDGAVELASRVVEGLAQSVERLLGKVELASWVAEGWAQHAEGLIGMVELASWVAEGLARSAELLVGMVELASWAVESWARSAERSRPAQPQPAQNTPPQGGLAKTLKSRMCDFARPVQILAPAIADFILATRCSCQAEGAAPLEVSLAQTICF